MARSSNVRSPASGSRPLLARAAAAAAGVGALSSRLARSIRASSVRDMEHGRSKAQLLGPPTAPPAVKHVSQTRPDGSTGSMGVYPVRRAARARTRPAGLTPPTLSPPRAEREEGRTHSSRIVVWGVQVCVHRLELYPWSSTDTVYVEAGRYCIKLYLAPPQHPAGRRGRGRRTHEQVHATGVDPRGSAHVRTSRCRPPDSGRCRMDAAVNRRHR